MNDRRGPTASSPDPAPTGLEQLATLGRPVVHQHARLAALIRAQLTAGDADFLAVPSLDADGRVAAWQAGGGRALRPLAELPPAARAGLEARAATIRGRLVELADRLSTQGDAGRVAAHSLRCALVTPDGMAALFADGQQPVLAWWGMARPGQARPELAPLSPATPGAAASAPAARNRAAPPPAGPATGAAPSGPSTGGAPDVSGTLPTAPLLAPDPAAQRPRRLPAVAWAVPLALLLLLGWLTLQAMTPLAPLVVERVEAAAPPEDPTLAPAARVAELEDALRRTATLRGRFAAACVALPPPEPPAPVEVRPALPPEPDREVAVLPPVRPPAAEPRREPTPRTEPPPQPRTEPRRPPAPPPVAAPAEPPGRAACNPDWPPGQTPRVLFVLDGSGSMADSIAGARSRMAAAKQSIGKVVQSLHKDIRTGLVSFSDCGATSRSPFYDASQRPTLLGQVNAVSPKAATSLATSITRAGNAAPGRAPSVMVVVSDGGDTCGGDPCAAARAARAAKPNLTINVIDLSGGSGGGVLQCVARAGGGQVFLPQSADQMSIQLQQATGQPDASRCP